MKTAIVFTAIIGACLGQVFPLHPIYAHSVVTHPVVHVARPVVKVLDPKRPPAILSQSAALNDDGSFNYGFESEDGIKASAAGSVKVISPEETAQVVQGSYSFTAPDGSVITRTYVADENGFHAEGADIPTPPPIPEAIARSLELNAQEEARSQA